MGVLKGNTSFQWRFSWEENINFVHVTFVTSKKKVESTKARKHRDHRDAQSEADLSRHDRLCSVPPIRSSAPIKMANKPPLPFTGEFTKVSPLSSLC